MLRCMHVAPPCPASNAVDTMPNICSCSLQALVSGDREQCSGVLAAARQSVVRALVSVSTETSADVNPAVLQLQQLSAIEAAWGVKWPQMQLQPQGPTLQVRQKALHCIRRWTVMLHMGHQMLRLQGPSSLPNTKDRYVPCCRQRGSLPRASS